MRRNRRRTRRTRRFHRFRIPPALKGQQGPPNNARRIQTPGRLNAPSQSRSHPPTLKGPAHKARGFNPGEAVSPIDRVLKGRKGARNGIGEWEIDYDYEHDYDYA